MMMIDSWKRLIFVTETQTMKTGDLIYNNYSGVRSVCVEVANNICKAHLLKSAGFRSSVKVRAMDLLSSMQLNPGSVTLEKLNIATCICSLLNENELLETVKSVLKVSWRNPDSKVRECAINLFEVI